MYRHGDLLIVRVGTVPAGARAVEGNVLAYGEATGHAHSAEGEVALYETANSADRWLRVGQAGARLTHQEHSTIVLPPGDYRVIRQREYQPEAARLVAD